MEKTALLMMFGAGAAIAFQSPINVALARSTGKVEASFVSFLVGTLCLAVVVAVNREGSLRATLDAPGWQLVGGALGAAFVTAFVFAVPRVGVASAMVAAMTGQILGSVLIDRQGWFGIVARPIDGRRALGVALLIVGVWLITSGRSKP